MLLFILFFQLSFTKQVTLHHPATYTSEALTGILADTTVNDIWDGNWKVLSTVDMSGVVHKIHGRGTLTRWIIDAPLTEQIFDSSINLRQVKTYGDRFSTAWYGVKSSNPDNWWNIQKSINVCMANHLACYTPGAGTYKYSKTLLIGVKGLTAWQQTSLHFFGDASHWDNGLGTSFLYTGKTGPALALQLNKGPELNNFELHGLYRSPAGDDMTYYNTKEEDYKDRSGNNLNDNYAGIAIDWYKPIDGTSRSGSTGVYIHEVSLEGFSMGLALSQNGVTLNDDNMTVDHLYFMDNFKYCIVNGQAQEKGMHFTNIYSWGSCYDVINIGLHGQHQAGNYSFDGVYIAGRCIQPFDVSVSHWYGQTFNNVFAESIARIGNFSSAGQTLLITNSTFDLTYPGTIGRQMIINSNALQTEFHNCTIRYFDDKNTDVWVRGYMTFAPNCYFGGGKIIKK